MIIALSGSFEVTIKDKSGTKIKHHLNRSFEGLYVPGMTWRQLSNFSTNAVALILASRPYEKGDYIYKYSNFISLSNAKNKC